MKSAPQPAIQMVKRAFPRLDKEAVQALVDIAPPLKHPAGSVLCQEGDTADAMLILGDGRVNVTQRLPDGLERTVSTFEAPNLIGEMALIETTIHAATIRALTEVTVLTVHQQDFIEAMKANPSLGLSVAEVSIARMRTRQHQAIEEVRQRRDELEAAYHTRAEYNRLLTAFLKTLGRELRDPVVQVAVEAHALQQQAPDSASAQVAMQRVVPPLKQVIRLVNDLLMVQEMDLIELKHQPVDVVELTRNVTLALKDKAARNRTPIFLHFADDLPALNGDYEGLRRIWLALVDNAVKFSPRGGDIRISAHAEGDHLIFEVSDKGIGIPEKALPGIFNRFRTRSADDHTSQPLAGLGLGLTIARYLVERHGGSISVRSTHNVGSTFTVRLPLRPAQEG